MDKKVLSDAGFVNLECFAESPQKLIVVGDGKQHNTIRKLLGISNLVFRAKKSFFSIWNLVERAGEIRYHKKISEPSIDTVEKHVICKLLKLPAISVDVLQIRIMQPKAVVPVQDKTCDVKSLPNKNTNNLCTSQPSSNTSTITSTNSKSVNKFADGCEYNKYVKATNKKNSCTTDTHSMTSNAVAEDNLIITDLKSAFDSFNLLIDVVKNGKKHLPTELSKIDGQLQDLQHYIEFQDTNVVVGYKLTKKMQELRRERRCIKDLIDICELFPEADLNTIIKLSKVLDDKTTQLNNRKYQMREPNLFSY